MLERDIKTPLDALVYFLGVAVSTVEMITPRKSTSKSQFARDEMIALQMLTHAKTFVNQLTNDKEYEPLAKKLERYEKDLADARSEWLKRQ